MISEVPVKDECRSKLMSIGMPTSIDRLVDAVEWLREQMQISVEVFLSGNTVVGRRCTMKEYTIRVSDNSGGNVSRYSTNQYGECLATGLEMALRIFF